MKRANVDSLQDEIRQKKKTTLGHLLSRAGRLMTAHALKEVHDAGFPEVREGWLSILRFVEDDGIRSIDLAKRLNVSKQAANRMVLELEGVGYLKRKPDPTDQRARAIYLTRKGYQAWLIGLSAMERLESALEQELGEKTLRAMNTGCTDLLARLETFQAH
jgi:DNA-binding MarR family transcriptional regulator